MTATGVGRRDGAALARGLGAPRHRLRRLHPHHRASPPRRGREAPAGGPRQRPRRHLPRHYEGLYCVSCEAYYLEDDLLPGNLCPIHERPVELMREENYFFRLSAYADRLLEHYEAHPEAVEPETRRNEVLSLIRGGLQDFSISRTTFDWGIPLPWDETHVMLRLVRRADELHHRRGLRRRPRAVRADVAGEHPLDRQGHPPVPRRLLAGDADGRRRRAADAGLGARVPHRGRQEDVEDEPHGDPPVPADSTTSARTPTATTACGRSRGAPTGTSRGSRWSSATTPTSRTGSGTWRAVCSRCSPRTTTASSRRRPSRASRTTCPR